MSDPWMKDDFGDDHVNVWRPGDPRELRPTADDDFAVYLPHSCGEWVIAASNRRDETLAQLDRFVAALGEARRKLGGDPHEDFGGADGTIDGQWVPAPNWAATSAAWGGSPSLIAEPAPSEPKIVFLADDHTPLLTLKVAGGSLRAEYDPARLDDAARALVERALGLGSAPGRVGDNRCTCPIRCLIHPTDA